MTISPQDAATPGRPEQVLQRTGLLGGAHVTGVGTVSQHMTVLSRIARRRITYDRAADAAPQTIHPSIPSAPRLSGSQAAPKPPSTTRSRRRSVPAFCCAATRPSSTRYPPVAPVARGRHRLASNRHHLADTADQRTVRPHRHRDGALRNHRGLGSALGTRADPKELAERFAGMREQLAGLTARFDDALPSDRVALIESSTAHRA